MADHKNIWLSVEGNISSGKTTFLTHLKRLVDSGYTFGLEGYKVYFIDEDIAAWGTELFSNFYADPKRWALTFQFEVIAVRARQIREMLKTIHESGKPALVISERSLESSKYIFAKLCAEFGNMTAMEKSVYDDCYRILGSDARTDLYVYCSTPPEICQERYVKRSREGEALDLDYLKKVHECHTAWLKSGSLIGHVIEIESAQEISDKALTSWVNKLSNLIYKPLRPAHSLYKS